MTGRTKAKKKSPAAIKRQETMSARKAETPEQTEAREAQDALSEREKLEKKRRKEAEERRSKAKRREALIGGKRNLVGTGRTDVHERYVNDDGNRVAQMLDAGYSFATPTPEEREFTGSTDPGDRISKVVGTKRDGSEMRSYLMQKPLDWHREDQHAKLAPVRKVEEQLKTGKVAGGLSENESYTPKDSGGVKIT